MTHVGGSVLYDMRGHRLIRLALTQITECGRQSTDEPVTLNIKVMCTLLPNNPSHIDLTDTN